MQELLMVSLVFLVFGGVHSQGDPPIFINGTIYIPSTTTTRNPLELDFSCQIGSNEDLDSCQPGQGNERFKTRFILKGECMRANDFIAPGARKARKPRQSITYACMSFFKWDTYDEKKLIDDDDDDDYDYYEDKDKKPKKIRTQYLEQHFCIEGTDKEIQQITQNKGECIDYKYPQGNLLVYEKVCTCTSGGGCNEKFKSKFKREPKATQSLCGSKDVFIKPKKGNDDDDDDDKDSSTKIFSTNNLAFIMIPYISYLFYC